MARRSIGKVKGLYERPRGSNNWYVRYKSDDGTDVRKSFGQNKRAAVEYADKVQLIRRSGQGVIPPKAKAAALTFSELELKGSAVTVADIVDDYLDYLKSHPAERKDQINPPRIARDIKRKFGERSAATLKPHEIDDWLDELQESRGLAPGTVNRIKATFSGIYSRAVQRSRVLTNPVRGVKQRRVTTAMVRYLTADEESRLRSAIENWRAVKAHLAQYQTDVIDHRLCELEFALGTGARKGEQYGLSWTEVDFNSEKITFIDTKNGDTRIVEMISDVKDALETLKSLNLQRRPNKDGSIPEGKVFAIGDNKKWFAQALKDAKISNFRWHDLRHTFCSRLAMAGRSPWVIQKAAGHKTIQMTARYSHLDSSTMREGLSVLNKRKAATSTAS